MVQVPTQMDVTIAVLGGLFTGIVAFRIPRQDLDRVPLSGLTLLILVYGLAGWGLAIARVPIGAWIGAAVAAMLVGFGSSIQLGRSGLVAFGFAGVSAIAWVLRQNVELARWSAIGFGLAGLWLWAVGGARYRMERAGFRRSPVQWSFAIVGWEGLWMGWLISTFVAPQVGTWLMQLG
ncbi:MAG: hypothetical protein KME18_01455 [Phormidium tanganyikae FI6-MK23]|jgi:hypothetical protein|nr:hypothetical protein [Phormidium tanganyikae FI6-MK23]